MKRYIKTNDANISAIGVQGNYCFMTKSCLELTIRHVFRFCNCQSYFLTNSLTVKVDCLGVLELNPPQGISCKFSRDLFNTINRFPLISEQYNTLSALPHTYSLRPFSLNHVCNFADLTSMCLLGVRL